MKTKFIFLIFIFNFELFSQNSLLSLNGFGEYLDTYDASSLSLGESRLFSTNFNGIALSSSSSFSKLNSSYLAMTVAFNEHDAYRLRKVNANIIKLISYTFPISKNSVLSLGMNPVFRSNLSLQEESYQIFGANESPIDINNDGNNDPVAYNTSYEFSGGISEFHGSFSSQIGSNFNIGLRLGKLFGSSIRSSSLKFYEINYSQNGQVVDFNLFSSQNSINDYKYSSYNYAIDFRFSMPNMTYVNEFVLIYGQSDKMKVEIDFNDSEQNQSFTTLNGMSNFGFGFKLDFLDDFGFIFEVNSFKSFKSNYILNIFNNDYPDINSVHIGFLNNFSNYTLRYGLSYKNYLLEEQTINDLGLTFGFGFNYLNNNAYNFGIKIGERKSDFYKMHDEKYFKLFITLISSEKWFIKKRK